MLTPDQVTDFDTHAAYYASHLDDWRRLPLWRGPTGPPRAAVGTGPAAEFAELVSALQDNGIRLAYRELTTPEPRAVGLHVLRVLSPDPAARRPPLAPSRRPHGRRAVALPVGDRVARLSVPVPASVGLSMIDDYEQFWTASRLTGLTQRRLTDRLAEYRPTCSTRSRCPARTTRWPGRTTGCAGCPCAAAVSGRSVRGR